MLGRFVESLRLSHDTNVDKLVAEIDAIWESEGDHARVLAAIGELDKAYKACPCSACKHYVENHKGRIIG